MEGIMVTGQVLVVTEVQLEMNPNAPYVGRMNTPVNQMNTYKLVMSENIPADNFMIEGCMD